MAAQSIPKSIKATLYIDGKPAEGTMKNLETVTNRLNRELKQLEVGTEAWNRKMREVQSHQKALNGLRNEIKGTAGAFGFLKTEIGKVGALAAGYLGFQFVTEQFRNIIMKNAELSDSFADVRKTTGLSEVAVRGLVNEFKNFDTRSSRKELLAFAEMAGKLGISAEKDVLGFVRAADKIGVALGKDLGNSEEAINSLGKLTDLFKIKDQFGLEDALIKTGSAINALGAAGTANEGYIVEFTKRLGTIAPAANISIENVMGLAATMDELGQPAEAATTALGQFIVGMGKDVPTFARVAKMSVKEFSDLLRKDANAALIAVLTQLKATGGGVQELAANMGLIGEDGARATAALSALAGGVDKLKDRQALSNGEFSKGTSIINEYNVKNQNFAANLEKLGKKLSAFFANTSVTTFLNNIVEGLINTRSEAEKLADAFHTQEASVVSLERKTMPLINRYDELKSKSTLTTTEQSELKKVISQIAEAIPSTVTEVDKYGRALGINTEKAREFVAVQKELLKYANKSAIESSEEELSKAIRLRDVAVTMMNNALKSSQIATSQGVKFASNKDFASLKSGIDNYNSDITNIQNRLKGLRGDLLDGTGNSKTGGSSNLLDAPGKTLDALKKKLESLRESRNLAVIGSKEFIAISREIAAAEKELELYDSKKQNKTQESAEKKALREFDKLKKDLEAWKNKAAAGDPNSDKELVDIENKYNELIKAAVGHQDQIDEIEITRKTLRNNRLDEIQKINDKKSRENAFEQLKKGYDQEDLIRTENLQQRLAEIDASDKTEIEKATAKAATLLENDDQVFQSKQERLVAEALLLEAHLSLGNIEADEQEKMSKRLIDLQKQVADNAISEHQRVADKKAELNSSMRMGEEQLQEAIYSAYQEGFALIGGLLRENSVAAKAFFLLEKVAAGAKIIISLQQQLAAIRLSAWLNPLFIADPTGAARAAFIATHSTIAKINAGIGLATVASQAIKGFAHGGFSNDDPAGYVNRDTVFARSSSGRPFRAGEAGREWIAPNWMLENPRTANLIGMLESARQNRGFAAGGSTGTEAAVFDTQGIEAMLARMVNMQEQMIRAQREANTKKVVLSYRELQDMDDDLVRISGNLDA